MKHAGREEGDVGDGEVLDEAGVADGEVDPGLVADGAAGSPIVAIARLPEKLQSSTRPPPPLV